MWRNFKLATKFSLLLSLVFIGAVFSSGLFLSQALERKAEAEISDRGQVLMEIVNSVREYTNFRINPLLAPKLETETQFIPEAIPTFATREVFEGLRQNPEYKNYLYKDAATNPTNLSDKADEFETNLIEQFRQNRDLKTISGFRDLFDEKLFYIARPFTVTKASCLRCHSTPAAAPKSHIATYGSENGFGWKLNDIVATQIIYVPASKVIENARQASYLFVGIFVFIFTVFILLIKYLLQQNVIRPLQPMAQIAEKVSTGTLNHAEAQELEFKHLRAIAKQKDELGQLGRIFQRMVQEVYTREQNLKQQIQELSIEIDQSKRVCELKEISETEYFQNLQNQAKHLRDNWDN